MKFISDLHRILSLGSAKEGVHFWIVQRLTALALIPLGLWFAYNFIILAASPYGYAQEWLTSSLSVALALSFVFAMFYHGYLGIQVILEDYVDHLWVKWTLLIFTKFLSIFMALWAAISILRIFLS